jgi:sugar/nucleoside kinase (ribokinase family)
MNRIGARFYGTPLKGGPTTARSMIAVTPDGERSMNTYLGASTEFAAADVNPIAVASGEWLYMEGYLFDKPAAKTAFVHASEVAKSAGRKVAVTMSDVFCIDRHRPSFLHLVRTHCDLVFANEAELLALYETSDFDAAMSQMRNDSQIAAITRSGKGSLIVSGSDSWVAPVTKAPVVDATGAGDQYAAGVLYGITHGLSLVESARLGNLAAGEVISHIGPRPTMNLRELAMAAGFRI